MSLISNIVSYWKLDESSGVTAFDSAGLNNATWQGTLGSQWTSGKIGNGGNFNGTDNYIRIGNPANLKFDVTNAFSIAMWVKLAANDANEYDFIGCINASPFNGWQFRKTTAKALDFYFNPDTGSSGQIEVHVANAIINTNWHHIVMAYSGNVHASGIQLYMDGSLGTMTTDADNFSGVANPGSIGLGAAGDRVASLMNGLIDEVGMWNRQISASEVSQLYNAGNGLQYPFAPISESPPIASSMSHPYIMVRDSIIGY